MGDHLRRTMDAACVYLYEYPVAVARLLRLTLPRAGAADTDLRRCFGEDFSRYSLRYDGPRFQVAHGSLTTHGFSLCACLVLAYQLVPAQIQGPDWLNDVRLDITAKAAGPVSEQQVRLMLQRLLADRMGVKVHREKKEMAVYVMTVAEGGPKFQETKGEGPMTAAPEKVAINIKSVSLFELAAEFSGKLLDRPVIDQTGLKGRYDIRVDMTPMRAAAAGGGEGEGWTGIRLRSVPTRLPP